jgi:peptidoglycan/LPS O-acetylase OafA/YrhL/4-amino-4-deoxy-L-arabinose transferase-like glycosyltransferase
MMSAPAGPSRPGTGRDRWTWALILGIALVVRVAYVLLTREYVPRSDSADYHRLAVSIAQGHGFGDSAIAPGGGPTAFRPPLYPGFLGALYAVFGVHIQLARLVQALLGVVSVGLVGALGWRLVGRRVGLVAAGIAAVYPPLVIVGTGLLSEPLAVPLELGAILTALEARRAERAGRWLALTGVLAGLGILNRPNTALLLVPLVLIVAPSLRIGRDLLRRAAYVGGAAFLVVAPWLVRDARAFGELVPLTTQSGLVMAGTYNDVSRHDGDYPAGWRPPTLVPEYREILAEHPGMDEVEMEERFRAEATSYLREHPTYLAEVGFWNTARLFDLTGTGTTRDAARAYGFSTAVADVWLFSYYTVALLALAGLAVGRPRLRVPAVWLVPVALVASIVFLHGITRMRAGIEPFIVLAGASAAVSLAPRLRSLLVAPSVAEPFRLGHRPALDGLRGLAIALVVAQHLMSWLLPGRTNIVSGGIIGVDLFFVLSGFLITTLLLQERRQRGRVSLRAFYRRRALRLLPALWCLLAVHAVLSVILGQDHGVELRSTFGAFFYVSNLVQPLGGTVAPDLAHLWSLAVEEQFYLLWPAALVVLLRKRLPVAGLLAVGIGASAVLRAVLAARSTQPIPFSYITPWSRLDGLLLGAAVAWALHRGWRLRPAVAQAAAVGGLVAIAALVRWGSIVDRFMYTWGFVLAALASAALVVAVLDERSWLARVASWRPLAAAGRLSYSLYLWHLLAFSFAARLLGDQPALVRVAAGLGGALAVSVTSYRFVERPFLRIKDAPATPPAVEPAAPATWALPRRYRTALASALAAVVGVVAVASAPAMAQRDDVRRERASGARPGAEVLVTEQPVVASGSADLPAPGAGTAEEVADPAAPVEGEAPAVPPEVEPAPADPVATVVATVLELAAPLAQVDPTRPTDAVWMVVAVLATTDGAALSGRTVVFTVGPSSCEAVTDAGGRAACTVAVPGVPAAAAPELVVRADYAGDATTAPAADEVTVPGP